MKGSEAENGIAEFNEKICLMEAKPIHATDRSFGKVVYP